MVASVQPRGYTGSPALVRMSPRRDAIPMNLQELILELQAYWSAYGCVLAQPYDVETGAGVEP